MTTNPSSCLRMLHVCGLYANVTLQAILGGDSVMCSFTSVFFIFMSSLIVCLDLLCLFFFTYISSFYSIHFFFHIYTLFIFFSLCLLNSLFSSFSVFPLWSTYKIDFNNILLSCFLTSTWNIALKKLHFFTFSFLSVFLNSFFSSFSIFSPDQHIRLTPTTLYFPVSHYLIFPLLSVF